MELNPAAWEGRRSYRLKTQRKDSKAVPHNGRDIDGAEPAARVSVCRQASCVARNQQGHLACNKLRRRRRQHSQVVNVRGRRRPAPPAHSEDDRVVSKCPQERTGRPAHAHAASQLAGETTVPWADSLGRSAPEDAPKREPQPGREAPPCEDRIEPVVSYALEGHALIGEPDCRVRCGRGSRTRGRVSTSSQGQTGRTPGMEDGRPTRKGARPTSDPRAGQVVEHPPKVMAAILPSLRRLIGFKARLDPRSRHPGKP